LKLPNLTRKIFRIICSLQSFRVFRILVSSGSLSVNSKNVKPVVNISWNGCLILKEWSFLNKTVGYLFTKSDFPDMILLLIMSDLHIYTRKSPGGNGDSVNRASWIGIYFTNTSCLYTKMFTNMSFVNQNKWKYHHLFLTIVTCHEMKAVVRLVSDHVTFNTGGVIKSTLDCQNSWFPVTIDV